MKKGIDKWAMIDEILIVFKANDVPITGDVWFSLIFRTENELRHICHELYIRTDR